MENTEVAKIQMLEKKQDLIISYYDSLKLLKLERKELNRKIKLLEDRFNELILSKDMNELLLFDKKQKI